LRAKCRESALLAIETNNKPLISFRSGGYIVHMMIAWTSAFLASFHQRGIEPYYTERDGCRVLVEGSPKCWDTAECIARYYGGLDSPAKKNLEFFIGLRNLIEHSYMPVLDQTIFG